MSFYGASQLYRDSQYSPPDVPYSVKVDSRAKSIRKESLLASSVFSQVYEEYLSIKNREYQRKDKLGVKDTAILVLGTPVFIAFSPLLVPILYANYRHDKRSSLMERDALIKVIEENSSHITEIEISPCYLFSSEIYKPIATALSKNTYIRKVIFSSYSKVTPSLAYNLLKKNNSVIIVSGLVKTEVESDLQFQRNEQIEKYLRLHLQANQQATYSTPLLFFDTINRLIHTKIYRKIGVGDLSVLLFFGLNVSSETRYSENAYHAELKDALAQIVSEFLSQEKLTIFLNHLDSFLEYLSKNQLSFPLNPNTRLLIDCEDGESPLPLYKAVTSKQHEITSKLLQSGADPLYPLDVAKGRYRYAVESIPAQSLASLWPLLSITQLDLSNAGIGNTKFKALAETYVKHAAHVTHPIHTINLANNKLKYKSAVPLLDLLSQCKSLTVLDISGNEFGGYNYSISRSTSGIQLILQWATNTSNMRYLNLSDNGGDELDASAVIELLSSTLLPIAIEFNVDPEIKIREQLNLIKKMGQTTPIRSQLLSTTLPDETNTLLSDISSLEQQVVALKMEEDSVHDATTESIANKDIHQPSASPSNSIRRAYTAMQTRGQGDCAFHAVYGEWDPQTQRFECPNVARVRQEVSAGIPALKDTHFTKLVAAIREQFQAERDRIKKGSALEKLREKYQTFVIQNKRQTDTAWQRFSTAFNENSRLKDYIKEACEGSDKASPDFKTQFYYALNENEVELRRRMEVEGVLDLFEAYENLMHDEFNWQAHLTDGVLACYAEYIAAPGNWLLPVELELIAFQAGIRIIYSDKSYGRFNENIYNPGGTHREVRVQFNGRSHYERMVSSTTTVVQQPSEQSYTAPLTLKTDSQSIDIENIHKIAQQLHSIMQAIIKYLAPSEAVLKKIELKLKDKSQSTHLTRLELYHVNALKLKTMLGSAKAKLPVEFKSANEAIEHIRILQGIFAVFMQTGDHAEDPAVFVSIANLFYQLSLILHFELEGCLGDDPTHATRKSFRPNSFGYVFRELAARAYDRSTVGGCEALTESSVKSEQSHEIVSSALAGVTTATLLGLGPFGAAISHTAHLLHIPENGFTEVCKWIGENLSFLHEGVYAAEGVIELGMTLKEVKHLCSSHPDEEHSSSSAPLASKALARFTGTRFLSTVDWHKNFYKTINTHEKMPPYSDCFIQAFIERYESQLALLTLQQMETLEKAMWSHIEVALRLGLFKNAHGSKPITKEQFTAYALDWLAYIPMQEAPVLRNVRGYDGSTRNISVDAFLRSPGLRCSCKVTKKEITFAWEDTTISPTDAYLQNKWDKNTTFKHHCDADFLGKRLASQQEAEALAKYLNKEADYEKLTVAFGTTSIATLQCKPAKMHGKILKNAEGEVKLNGHQVEFKTEVQAMKKQLAVLLKNQLALKNENNKLNSKLELSEKNRVKATIEAFNLKVEYAEGKDISYLRRAEIGIQKEALALKINRSNPELYAEFIEAYHKLHGTTHTMSVSLYAVVGTLFSMNKKAPVNMMAEPQLKNKARSISVAV